MANNEANLAKNSDANQGVEECKQNQQQKKGFRQGNDDGSKLNQTHQLKSENGTVTENREPLTYGDQRKRNDINGENAVNQKEHNGKRRENNKSYEKEENGDDNAEGLYSKRDYAEPDAIITGRKIHTQEK